MDDARSIPAVVIDRGCRLVEVPDEEYDSMGCNVLAVRPGVVVAIDGNPETRRRMEPPAARFTLRRQKHLCPGLWRPHLPHPATGALADLREPAPRKSKIVCHNQRPAVLCSAGHGRSQ